MKIEFKSFLIGGFSLLSFFLLSGQIYYKDDKIIEKLNSLNLNDEIISSEINEIFHSSYFYFICGYMF